MGRIPTIYYCSYENCSASFNRKHRLETHIRSHTGERPFICSYEGCGKIFTCSSHLKRHEDTHGSSYRCVIENCSAVLKTSATLKKHVQRVHLKLKKHKVYTCTQCGKEFNKHNTLQIHELRHSGELPHKCSVEDCQKSFLTPSKLKRHMKVHEGYSCDVSNCNKVFEKWSLYVQHKRDCHRPENRCQVCNKVFRKFFNLKLHVSLHEESRAVYPCEVPNCSRYYFDTRNLKWHMRKYHAKRPFMCDKENCNRAFKSKADLAEHILYHGRRKPRKKKKKPKPSLAAILSGYAEIKQVSNEEKTESNASISSSNVNLADLEPDAIETSSVYFLEPSQSSIMEENNSSILTNEGNIGCTKSFKFIQSGTLKETDTSLSTNSNDSSAMETEIKLLSKEEICEMDQLSIADQFDSSEIDNLTSEFIKSAVQEYTTIEVIGSEHLPQLISVPIIKIDKPWNRSNTVRIKTNS